MSGRNGKRRPKAEASKVLQRYLFTLTTDGEKL
jgi:hypothetical protein